MSGYDWPVRTLLTRLVLLIAVLLMPFGMTPAAAEPNGHPAMAGMPIGHCDERAPKQHVKGGLAECTMACSAALPAAETPRDQPPLSASSTVRPLAATVLHGLHPETATPPPRIA